MVAAIGTAAGRESCHEVKPIQAGFAPLPCTFFPDSSATEPW